MGGCFSVKITPTNDPERRVVVVDEPDDDELDSACCCGIFNRISICFASLGCAAAAA